MLTVTWIFYIGNHEAGPDLGVIGPMASNEILVPYVNIPVPILSAPIPTQSLQQPKGKKTI